MSNRIQNPQQPAQDAQRTHRKKIAELRHKQRPEQLSVAGIAKSEA